MSRGLPPMLHSSVVFLGTSARFYRWDFANFHGRLRLAQPSGRTTDAFPEPHG